MASRPTTGAAAPNPAAAASPSAAVPLRVVPLHYPGDGLHLIAHPGLRTVYLGTPEARGQPFCCRQARHPSPISYTVVPAGVSDAPGYRQPWLSLGPVLLYAQLFADELTDLVSLEEAFEQAYPGTPPPIPMNRRHLIPTFAPHIYPLVPDTRKRSTGLWKDLVAHGLGRFAETLALAAQDRSYRERTGRGALHTQRRSLVELIRSLPALPAPHPTPRKCPGTGPQNWNPPNLPSDLTASSVTVLCHD